uniref:phytanoyl-CoA dioxygenase n=1 Tax=Hydra vulgaris TaxID=6087 RepID=T2MJ14_HYDVU
MAYKFTLENKLLTEEQRDFYEKNGFLVVKNLVSCEELKRYEERFSDICDKRVPCGEMTVMRDVNQTPLKNSNHLVYKIQDFQADSVLSNYFKNPSLLKYAECFVGKCIMAIHTMLINKPPDCGKKSSRHPIHQDLFYFPLRPADRIVCAWTAMENINRHNGGLIVKAGTHTQELLPHQYPQWEGKLNKGFLGINGFDKIKKKEFEYLEMETGDTVFFHPLLFHGSGRNKTQHFRKAISCHYASADCNFIDVAGTIQEVIKTEIDDIFKKRFPNLTASFEDIWRFKQVFVQGDEKSKL